MRRSRSACVASATSASPPRQPSWTDSTPRFDETHERSQTRGLEAADLSRRYDALRKVIEHSARLNRSWADERSERS